MRLRRALPLATTLFAGAMLIQPAAAGQEKSTAIHTKDVQRHGDVAMGFSHLKTIHHFTLTPSGGYIRVAANASADNSTREMVRMHLAHIAQAFKAGDFSSPLFTHGRVPPGVPVLKRMKGLILYKYQDTEDGGQVGITSRDFQAVAAIHEFLRFQIQDHQTGDSTAVQP
ncbi:MAG TPA: hypothetical protein VGR48_12910 [Terriglobales bacterium]|nr:hypothetical protein [Terriglobales bacterium]